MKKESHDYSTRLKKRFPNFEKGWESLVNEVGIELVNSLKAQLKAEYSFIKEITGFKFKMIVDNNFIFGQIKGAIKNKKSIEQSLLFKLMASTSVEIFAPPLLREELVEKINQVVEKEDQELAMSYAMVLLPQITIKEAFWIDNWKKANNLIGAYDPDDVSYLALAFEIGGHGILSFDEVFHKQGDVRVWQHRDASKVVSNYNSGFISLVLMDQTGQLFAKLIGVIFRFVRDAIKSIVALLLRLAACLIEGIASIPPIILAGLIALGIIYFDEIKSAGTAFFQWGKEKAKELVVKIKVAIKEILDLLSKVIEVGQLGATVAFEFLGFLVGEFNKLNDQVASLSFEQSDLVPLPVVSPLVQKSPANDAEKFRNA